MQTNAKGAFRLRRRFLAAAAAALILGGVAGGAYASLAGATGNSGADDGPRPAIGKMPADANGDGVISDSGVERIPALISAVGDHGTAGYVKYADLYGTPAPATPQAALAAQAQTRVIPVYAADGVTVVDTLTATPAHGVIEKTAP